MQFWIMETQDCRNQLFLWSTSHWLFCQPVDKNF